MKEEYGVTYANLKFNNGYHYANALYTYTRTIDNDYTSALNQKCMVIQVFSRNGAKSTDYFQECINYSNKYFYGIELSLTNQVNEFAYFYTNNEQNQIIYGFKDKYLNDLRQNSGTINASSQIKYIRARYGKNYIYVAYQKANYNLHIAIIYLDGSTTYSKVHDFEIYINAWSNKFTIQAYKNGKALVLFMGNKLYKAQINPVDGTYDINSSSGKLYSTIKRDSNLLKNNSEFVDDGVLISVTISGYNNIIEIFTYDMDGNEICFNSQTLSLYDFKYSSFTLRSRYEMYIIAKYTDGISRIITANPMTCAVSNPGYNTDLIYTFGFLFTQPDKKQKMMLFGQNDGGNYYKIFIATIQSCSDYYVNDCSGCDGNNKDSSNECKCNSDYYETSFTQCLECTTALRDDLRCKPNQCYSSSLCKECIGDQDQEYTRFLGTCDCPVGYYDDFPSHQNCQECNEKCGNKGCLSETVCINCIGGGAFPRIETESCKCPVKSWDDYPNQLNCQKCDDRCGDLGCESPVKCNNCAGSQNRQYSRFGDMCDKCNVGYYDDFPNKIDCQKCPFQCGSEGCKNSTVCYNCANGFSYKNGFCQICPPICQFCQQYFIYSQINQNQKDSYLYEQQIRCNCQDSIYYYEEGQRAQYLNYIIELYLLTY
ncbi:Insulin-like growth factor binding protein, N-terminal [Pseudocohnilembus persalinus]|uniref:Insulin-like growth factor binding protein, N-terminal n=1 Tax=Pseudocohnilembus persalinus TaxID=266149 RepID=A0A0V0QKI3_PSEPJ|nr:Insulin-like growth factor binding protein, N-terminal [Pseudocohnilembus persalinus]|eukprot:KRX02690.1 Insulin-like growth factor binding protein, N-terminal [Pseudocohnilembus persalinus]